MRVRNRTKKKLSTLCRISNDDRYIKGLEKRYHYFVVIVVQDTIWKIWPLLPESPNTVFLKKLMDIQTTLDGHISYIESGMDQV